MLGTEKYEEPRRSYVRSMADALRRYASNPIEDILRLFDLIACQSKKRIEKLAVV